MCVVKRYESERDSPRCSVWKWKKRLEVTFGVLTRKFQRVLGKRGGGEPVSGEAREKRSKDTVEIVKWHVAMRRSMLIHIHRVWMQYCQKIWIEFNRCLTLWCPISLIVSQYLFTLIFQYYSVFPLWEAFTISFVENYSYSFLTVSDHWTGIT